MPEENQQLIACLANLSVKGIWLAEFKDKSEARKLETAHTVAENSARVEWTLFPEKTCGKINGYTKWRSAYGRVYTYHRKNTWPWQSPLRLVRGSFHAEYDKEVRRLIDEMDAAFSEFIAAYPALKELAQIGLNGKWEDVKDEYPAAVKLQANYIHSLGYLPLSTSDHFCQEIAGTAIQQAKEALKAREKELVEDGKKFAVLELVGPISNLAEMLSKPKPIIRDSLIENCHDACKRMKALNIAADPQVEKAAQDIVTMLNGITSESLRENSGLRTVVSAQALAVAQRFGGLGTRKFAEAA